MKTISVENCLDVIPNKFKLSLIAMDRAKRLMLGAKSDAEYQNIEKNSYVALKEIEDGKIDIDEAIKNTKQDLLTDNLFKKKVNDNQTREDDNNFEDDYEEDDENANFDDIDFNEDDDDDDFEIGDDVENDADLDEENE